MNSNPFLKLFTAILGGVTLAVMLAPNADAQSGAGPTPSQTSLRGEQLPDILQQIEQSEYQIQWQASRGALMAPNRAQNLRFTFLNDGFAAEVRDPSDARQFWSTRFHLLSVGRPGLANKINGESNSWTVAGSSANVAAGGITMEYSNKKDGMRQDLIIGARPAGSGPVALDFLVDRVTAGMTMQVDGTSNVVFLLAAGGQVLASYRDLNVYDSTGRHIDAKMIKGDDDHFSIVWNDDGAQYPVTIDPLFQNDGYLFNNTGQASSFGYAIAYFKANRHSGHESGLLIGAPFYDPGSLSQAGAAFLYYVGPGGTLPSSPTWTTTGTQAYEHLGWCIADAGVVYGSLQYIQHSIIVGAPGYSTQKGAAFVYYNQAQGGISFHSSPDWSVVGSTTENLGWSVAGARDINNDGYDDILVGSPAFSQGASYNGAIRAFYGHSGGLSTSADWTAVGPAVNYGQMGTSVCFGDFNGDGKPDVASGAPGDPSSSSGYAQVFINNSWSLPTYVTTTLAGGSVGDQFGTAVASGFDQDADGTEDLLVGAPDAAFNSNLEAGKAYLFRGGSTGLSTTNFWSDGGRQANNHFGTCVAGGDMNGDGYADVMVGAPGYSSVNPPVYNGNGIGYLYTTSSTAPHSLSVYAGVYGVCDYVNMGTSMAYCPDFVNGDVDMAVAGPGGTSTCVSIGVLAYP